MSPQRARLPAAILVGATAILLATLGGEAALAAQALPTKVGDLGDPSHLRFEGVQTFTGEQIRRALAGKPSYHLTAHPQAEMRPFLGKLQQMIQAGYQATGFPDAQVAVGYDAATSKVRVKVTEGPRFKAGKIRLLGVRTVPVQEFERWFTTPGESPEEDEADSSKGGNATSRSNVNAPGKAERPEDPMWVVGDPADFTSDWATQALAQVEACLAEQGFFLPKATVELQRAPGAGTADLLITIQRLGPPGVINQINVTGAKRNSASDIIQFLGLRKGLKLTASRLVEARRKLHDCGRFWDFEITPEFPGDDDKVSGRYLNLHISVKELEGVARLNEALTPIQQALVRVCEWLEQFPSRDEDMLVKVSGQGAIPFAVELVVAPRHGLLLNSADLGGASPVSAGLLLGEESLQFCAWASDTKLAAPREGGGTFFVHLLPNRDETSNRFNLSFGAGYSGVKEDADEPTAKPLIKFDVQLMRAFFLDLPVREGGSCQLAGGRLTVSNSFFTLRADAATGRMIELVSNANQPAFSARFSSDAWKQASDAFARRAAPLTNIYTPGRGFASFLALAGTEVLRWKLTAAMNSNVSPDQRARAITALQKLLNPEVLATLNPFPEIDETNTFHFPKDEVDRAIEQNIVAKYLAAFAVLESDELFPKQSWPWTIAREGAFVVIGQGRYTEVELERLANSEDTGPIGCLAIAQLLAAIGSPSAKDLALLGLVRVSDQDFLRDCNLILRGDSGLSRSFANLAAALRTLPAEELEALSAILPPAEAEWLRDSGSALRTQPNAPLDSVLSPALAKYWQQSLKAEVRKSLFSLTRSQKEK